MFIDMIDDHNIYPDPNYKPEENLNPDRPLSKREIKRMKKRMSRKERRHTDFPGDPVKGRRLHGWATFFFVLTCVGTGLTGAMIILPFFLTLFGLMSAIVWVVYILVVSIFTLGMYWLSDEAKSFNEGWMNFNNSLFDRTNDLGNFAVSTFPFILVSGAIIIAISWILLLVGVNTDPARKKKYVAQIIALGVITLIYIVFLAFNLIQMGELAKVSNSSSSSII